MSYKSLTFRKWQISYDDEATRQAYNKILMGGAGPCGCDYCKNFVAVRDKVYPSEVHNLFDIIGVDYRKETEVFECGPLKEGLRYYGGWFHFVGYIESGTDALEQADGVVKGGALHLEQIDKHFSIGFTTMVGLLEDPFIGQQIVQIEFFAKVPWVLATEPE